MTGTSPPAVIRLRARAYVAWTEHEGLGSEVAQAQRIGVSSTNLNRILRGDVTPGEHFIAQLLAATGAKFEDLFQVEAAA